MIYFQLTELRLNLAKSEISMLVIASKQIHILQHFFLLKIEKYNNIFKFDLDIKNIILLCKKTVPIGTHF